MNYNPLLSIVLESELIENLRINPKTVQTNSETLMKNLSRDTITAFLDCPDTHVKIIKLKNHSYAIIANNDVANESIRIDCLGDHFSTLIMVMGRALDYVKLKNNTPNLEPLTNDFIKEINLSIQSRRCGEIAIGEYRFEDFIGRPVEVVISNGEKHVTCFKTSSSKNYNVYRCMDTLVKWVNSKNFTNGDILLNIAKFHAEFIKIHPFRDGNGRTARLLTNLLYINGLDMINIPESIKRDYMLAISYAVADSNEAFIKESEEYANYYEKIRKLQGHRTPENKYLPLKNLFNEYRISTTNIIINDVLNYKNGIYNPSLKADQINPDLTIGC